MINIGRILHRWPNTHKKTRTVKKARLGVERNFSTRQGEGAQSLKSPRHYSRRAVTGKGGVASEKGTASGSEKNRRKQNFPIRIQKESKWEKKRVARSWECPCTKDTEMKKSSLKCEGGRWGSGGKRGSRRKPKKFLEPFKQGGGILIGCTVIGKIAEPGRKGKQKPNYFKEKEKTRAFKTRKRQDRHETTGRDWGETMTSSEKSQIRPIGRKA